MYIYKYVCTYVISACMYIHTRFISPGQLGNGVCIIHAHVQQPYISVVQHVVLYDDNQRQSTSVGCMLCEKKCMYNV